MNAAKAWPVIKTLIYTQDVMQLESSAKKKSSKVPQFHKEAIFQFSIFQNICWFQSLKIYDCLSVLSCVGDESVSDDSIHEALIEIIQLILDSTTTIINTLHTVLKVVSFNQSKNNTFLNKQEIVGEGKGVEGFCSGLENNWRGWRCKGEVGRDWEGAEGIYSCLWE